MKIDITQLKEGRNVLSETCSNEELDIEVQDIKLVLPLEVTADITKNFDNLYILFKIKGKFQVVCSRCLENFSIDIAKEFSAAYLVEKEEPIIDLTRDIRQEIILDYPMKNLCQKDCKGLCPKCGKNLNTGKCDCQIKT